MPLILGTNSIKDTGYNVANSLRFNDDSTDYLNRTPGSDGNRKTWTFSTWIKRGNIGIGNPINVFGGEDGGSRYSDIMIGTPSGADDTFWFKQDTGTVAELRSSAKLRDTAAWYHLVFTYDSTDSTAADRMKMYVNGVRLTDFVTNTNAGENVDSYVNTSGDPNYIGIYQASSKKLDAYLCETVLIDGTALAADSFGEFDSDSGIWKPKKVSGLTFGTNGFYMEYKGVGTDTNSDGMGADTSGNDNHFAVTNLTAVDQSSDTCTNNFCTMNPLDNFYQGATFTEGNCVIATASSPYTYNTATIGISSGKWYWEGKALSVGSGNSAFGIISTVSTSTSDEAPNKTDSAMYKDSGVVRINNGAGTSIGAVSNNDIISFAYDADNNFIYFALNGTYQNSGDPTSGASGTGGNDPGNVPASTATGFYFPMFSDHNSGSGYSMSFNFGGSPAFAISSGNTDGNGFGNFEYAVPSGYFSICTKNLAENG